VIIKDSIIKKKIRNRDQWQIPSSKQVPSDYHIPVIQGVQNQSYHETREQNDDKPAEQYLQVDPRCYVRQNSNVSVNSYRKSETPRLEKGHSLNVDTRPTYGSSLSPYRQSSFDVTLAYGSHNQPQPSTPSPAVSTQQEIYFTPRGSNLSVVGNPPSNTPTDSQRLSPLTPTASKKNSAIEKKDVTVKLDPNGKERI
jgi:hypothetical protein